MSASHSASFVPLAVTRTQHSPSREYGATVGFAPSIKERRRVSIALSPMPKKRIICERITAPESFWRYGIT